MNATIVYAHPWNNSFNHAILEKVIETLKGRNDEVSIIDLYKDKFNPVMTEEDLNLYMKGESADPLVVHYNEILDKTDKIIFIFPIWWYDMPAIMRGFLDKVLLSGSSYIEDNGMHPVRNIEHTVILTTSSAPTDSLINDFGDPMNGTMIKGTFNAVGFFNAVWHNYGVIGSATRAETEHYLTTIPELV